MTLNEIIKHACDVLPSGWTVELAFERGAAWVSVVSPEGSMADIEADCETPLSDQVLSAVALCKTLEGGAE